MKEGKLEALIEIENQTEIVLEDADSKILDKIKNLVETSEATRLLRSGKPKTTLERLFLKETGVESEDVRIDA